MALGFKESALLLIDIQKGLDEWEYYGGERNNPHAEENMAKILAEWRIKERPIFHVRHSSANPNSPLHASKPGFQIKHEVLPLANEPVITKNVNSAFIGTDLEQTLKSRKIKKVVVIGLTTNHCISTSVRMAANLGFKTLVVSDACAAFGAIGVDGTKFDGETIHQTALASLNEEFAEILEMKELLKITT